MVPNPFIKLLMNHSSSHPLLLDAKKPTCQGATNERSNSQVPAQTNTCHDPPYLSSPPHTHTTNKHTSTNPAGFNQTDIWGRFLAGTPPPSMHCLQRHTTGASILAGTTSGMPEVGSAEAESFVTSSGQLVWALWGLGKAAWADKFQDECH